MNQELNVLITLAEIAGVFVGFGALISVTGGIRMAKSQLSQIRAVVTIGLVVVVASLIPVGLSRYHPNEQPFWVACSVLFLMLIWGVNILAMRSSDHRQLTLNNARSKPIQTASFWLMLELPMQIPLIIIVLGIFPSIASALYITAIIINLFQAAFVLAQFVYFQHDHNMNTSNQTPATYEE
jgi:hypothetical protein